MFMPSDELRIGQVVEVSGVSIKVEISNTISELTRTYEGRVYPIGQIGSMVKIHYGRKIIFGIITMLRMRSEELIEVGQPVGSDSDQRLMEVQLLAEGDWTPSKRHLNFKRGIKTYPLPQQGVYLLTNEETGLVYRSAEGESPGEFSPLVPFAVYSSTESTKCRANINKMFGMHCAVLGSTGSGKSGTVAAIIHSILEHKIDDKEISPQIVIIDPHGEYGAAFEGRSICFRAYDISDGGDGQVVIKLPYWLMSKDEFTNLVIGKTEFSATSQHNVIQKALSHARMVAAGIIKKSPDKFGDDLPNFDQQTLCDGHRDLEILEFDIDKPRPFSLDEFENHIKYVQGGRYSKSKHESNSASELSKLSIPSILDKLSVLRKDSRLAFMMGEWRDQEEQLELHEIINQFVGAKEAHNQHARIIDISGLPNEVAGPLTGLIARILFQYKLFQNQAEKEKDPLLLVCEEAHRYVPDKGEAQYAVAQQAIRRIAKEGRKYGIGLMLVSQRPADVDSTVISQCGTWVVLRLTNSADQQHVARFLPDGLSGMVSALPVLSQQEAIFVGEGAALPSRIKIDDLPKGKLPRSNTIPFAQGWANESITLEEIKVITDRMIN